ncbi:MAG: DUF3667 domain-containing protein [Bacteroidia bacterium]|nr:DUF3667 domain-containing protein [Bacteroidia bacterium]
MECKNCKNPLSDLVFYCEKCGAKVIRNRLNLKNLFSFIIESYFNIDNSFLKTIIYLFKDPRDVIHGYITGLRKKYMNPIAFMTIAITLSGFLVILIQQKMGDLDLSLFNAGANQEGVQNFNQKVLAFTNEYSSLLYLLFIPVFAFAGWLTFNKNGYNLTEYTVVITYAQAQFSLLTFPFSVAILYFAPQSYLMWSLVFSFFMVALIIYIIQMLNRYDWGSFIARMIAFLGLLIVGYIGLIIIIYILLFATGTITLEDFKNMNQATSSAINWASYNLV